METMVMKEERSLTWIGLRPVFTLKVKPRFERRSEQKKMPVDNSWEVSEQLARLF